MCEMEGGAGCYLYPCGAAAVTNAILSFVETGDHVLMTGAAYEPTQDFCNVILKKMHIDTTYYDPMIGADVAKLVQPNTKVLFLESPSSLTMEVPDIPAIVKAVRAVSPEIVIMIDNTWAGGVLFKALEHGIDISIQAGTKYLVGHSDIMIGTAVANARAWDKLREHSYLMGQMIDADSAYTTARGIRTLGVRLKQHHESSLKVAKWLSEQPQVKAVDHFELFTMAYSWGGFESLILCNQPEEIAKIRPGIERKLTGSLIRLHIGFEDTDELIADLQAGFDRIK